MTVEDSLSTAKPRVTVVVPTYNERDNLPELAKSLDLHGYRVLIVDDASPDGTGEIANELAGELASVSVLHRDRREGLGPAYSAGFNRALSEPVDIICGMDADFSHDPQVLPGLVAPVANNEADMVVGSRYIPGGGTQGWPFYRQVLSRAGNSYARFMLGLQLHDVTSGYRVFRAETLRGLDFDSFRGAGYLYLTETVWRATRRGVRIVEVPITFRDRQRGQSKMSARIILEAMGLVTLWGLYRLVGR